MEYVACGEGRTVRVQSALDMLHDESFGTVLGCGCPILDALLGGGLRTRTLNEFAGEAGVGKTQFGLTFACCASLPREAGGLGRTAIYLSTEGEPPIKRMHQICEKICSSSNFAGNLSASDILENIYVAAASTQEEKWNFVSSKVPLLLAQKDVGVLVIDSLANTYRSDYDNYQTRAADLSREASFLKRLAYEHNLVVIVTNHVSDLIVDTEEIEANRTVVPALGLAWSNCVNTRVMLTRTRHNSGASTRLMRVTLSPNLPGDSCRYDIGEVGVFGIASEAIDELTNPR